MQAYLFLPESVEAAGIKASLQSIGFLVKRAQTSEELLAHWPHALVDLVILDVFELDADLFDQLRQIRVQANSAIITITEGLTEKEKLRLYEAGVDLVVDRPYSTSLLVAQIKAMQRRVTGVPYFTLPVMTIGGLMLDPTTRTVEVEGMETTRLTQLEFRLLYTLMTHPRQVLPTEMLVESVWGYSDTGNRELVRGLVKRLRRKVEIDPRHPRHIVTTPGVGYQLLDE